MHWAVYAGVGIGIAVLALSFVPVPGLYNVTVPVTLTETCILFVCSYGANSVNPTTTGAATLIDWGGWFAPTGNLGACAIGCTYKVTVTMSGPATYTASGSETKLVGNVASIGISDTVHFAFAYVEAGTYQVHAELTVNGADEADASGLAVVGGG